MINNNINPQIALRQEIVEKGLTNKSKGAKMEILTMMNRIKDYEELDIQTKTFSQLNIDFTTIREHLWSSYEKGELDMFKYAVTRNDKTIYTGKDAWRNKPKVRLQSKKVVLLYFYC